VEMGKGLPSRVLHSSVQMSSGGPDMGEGED